MVWTAEAFLQKRYAAGFKVGYAEGLKIGYAKGRAKIRGRVEMLLEEHPDATAAQLREFLINSRDDSRTKGASD